MKQYLFLFIILIVAIVACKKKTVESIDTKLSYYPMAVGKYIIYDVDSIVYNDFTHQQNKHSLQVKFLYADTFRDQLNDLTFRLERYERENSNAGFVLKDVWSAKQLPGRIEVVEENQRFIKFASPVILSATWHGNTFITPDLNDPTSKFLTDWEYTYTSLDESFDLHGVTYDSVVTVLEHQEEIPQLESSEFKTIYAKHIGPVYMHRKFLEKQPSDLGWQGGFDVTYFINDHN